MQHLTLYQLNAMVRDAVRLCLPDALWITAEISEMRQASNGHCYLELVDKDELAGGAFRAKARATIWKDNSELLLSLFTAQTGQRLVAGLKVLLQVRVVFHEVYGYSLNVVDLDPTYTLGDVARRRQEILHQLQADGVLELNKELPLPRPLRRIAVISAAGAAGYGDFTAQLSRSGHAFECQLFEATMQGLAVESSIIAALDRIVDEQERWDCVVILRGGGAVSDLNGFDTYLLATSVAQFPLPIFTGIGHERDETLLDLVAHTRFKTPTAVAAYLIELRADETQLLTLLEQRLFAAAQQVLERKQLGYERLAQRYQNVAQQYLAREQALLVRLAQRMQQRSIERLHIEQQQVLTCSNKLAHAVHRLLENRVAKLEQHDTLLRMASPERILSQGYSLTLLPDGSALRSVADAPRGTRLRTQVMDGTVESVVEK